MERVSVAVTKRSFLKLSLITAGAAISYRLFFSKEQSDTLALLQNDLFPPISDRLDTKTINARKYLSYILHHPRVSEIDKQFLRNGISWLNEESLKLFQKEYRFLEAQSRQKVLEHIADTQWGERFIESNLTYIFEALLGDPIYGINKNEEGWKWLHHTPGFPRPTTPA